METAPRDGSRILVQCAVLHSSLHRKGQKIFEPYGYFYVAGWTWRECWFDGEKWQPWSGSVATWSTSAAPDNEHYVRAWAHTPFDPVRKVEPIWAKV